MNKRGMGSMTFIFMLFVLTVGMLYINTEKAGLDKQNVTDKLEIALRNATDINLNISTPDTPEIGNAITYYMNGLFLAYGEIAIWGVKFAEQNPQAPYKLLMFGLFLAILAPLIIVLFKLLVIIFLLTKEFIQSRKEKREVRNK